MQVMQVMWTSDGGDMSHWMRTGVLGVDCHLVHSAVRRNNMSHGKAELRALRCNHRSFFPLSIRGSSTLALHPLVQRLLSGRSEFPETKVHSSQVPFDLYR